jgi:hypothetical protein
MSGRFTAHPHRGISGRHEAYPDWVREQRTRYVCCVCGDPNTLDATDYVEVVIQVPDEATTQWLGAHASCLRRAFVVQVEPYS